MKAIDDLLKIDRKIKDKKLTTKEAVIILENKQRMNLKHYGYRI